MSIIKTQKTACGKIHFERFETAEEVVATCNSRELSSSSFEDMKKESIRKSWHGVDSYAEALELMKTGYQPSVEALRDAMKVNVSGDGKRFSFKNSVEGFAPVVPLALMGVPNSMVNMTMKPIKAKVVDVYYDMTVVCDVSPKQILENGNKLLGAVVELEKRGYRFNLYAVQGYADSTSCDMMIVKVKSASRSLDIKRTSFPLTHTAFFRVIGFDWQSRVPGGKYRWGRGNSLVNVHGEDKVKTMARELFGKNAIYFSASSILNTKKDHIKEVLTNGNSKA